MPFPRRSGAAKIQGMVSSEKEGFDLCTKDITPPEKGAAPVDGPVEEWMTRVEQAMKDSLKVISKTGIFNYASSPRSEWILDADVLGMVTLAGQCSASSTVPSRHRRDSCPSDEVVGGFLFGFEPLRTASSDRDASRRPGRHRRDPHTPPTPSRAPRLPETPSSRSRPQAH